MVTVQCRLSANIQKEEIYREHKLEREEVGRDEMRQNYIQTQKLEARRF